MFLFQLSARKLVSESHSLESVSDISICCICREAMDASAKIMMVSLFCFGLDNDFLLILFPLIVLHPIFLFVFELFELLYFAETIKLCLSADIKDKRLLSFLCNIFFTFDLSKYLKQRHPEAH